MEHWYAIYTKPKKEHQVNTFLQGQGIVTYLPTAPRKVRRRDRPERVVYFPCYLFARLDFEAIPHSSVAWMPGVRRIVSWGEQPAVVPEDIVRLIQSRLDERAKEDDRASYGDFKPGDQVRIVSGPLHDLNAVFDRAASAAERVRVLLDVLGRMTPVEVDVSEIQKIYSSDQTVARGKTRRRP